MTVNRILDRSSAAEFPIHVLYGQTTAGRCFLYSFDRREVSFNSASRTGAVQVYGHPALPARVYVAVTIIHPNRFEVLGPGILLLRLL